MTTSLDEIAKQYGMSVDVDGQILNSKGKPTGATVETRKNRLRVSGKYGLLYSGPTDSLGAFIERFWDKKKVS